MGKRALGMLSVEEGNVTAAGNLAVTLYDAAGGVLLGPARLAADNLALPTGPDVLATLLAYDGALQDMARMAALFTSSVSPVGVLAAGAVIYNATSGLASWARTASADGAAANSNLAVVPVVSYDGVSGDKQRTPKVFKTVQLGSGTVEETIWTPASGKKFRLMGFVLSTDAVSTLTFKDNTGGTTIFVVRPGLNIPISENLGNGILSAAANNLLTVTRSVAAGLNGTVWGTEE